MTTASALHVCLSGKYTEEEKHNYQDWLKTRTPEQVEQEAIKYKEMYINTYEEFKSEMRARLKLKNKVARLQDLVQEMNRTLQETD